MVYNPSLTQISTRAAAPIIRVIPESTLDWLERSGRFLEGTEEERIALEESELLPWGMTLEEMDADDDDDLDLEDDD